MKTHPPEGGSIGLPEDRHEVASFDAASAAAASTLRPRLCTYDYWH